MKYIGENAIKKLISLIKGDLATKQPTITASGLLKGDGAGTVTAADTQEATLVDVPNGLLKGDGTTISQAVAGTDYAAITNLHGRNLLDNPWFTVNQRGQNSYTPPADENIYCVDRFVTNGGALTISDTGVIMDARGYLVQFLENHLVDSLQGKPVTLSVMSADGEVYSTSIASFDKNEEYKEFGAEFEISYLHWADKPSVIIRNQDYLNQKTVRAVKLELGSVSTLANDVAPNYAEELAKCQRYYYQSWSGPVSEMTSDGACGFVAGHIATNPEAISFPVEMRAIPSIILYQPNTRNSGEIVKWSDDTSVSAYTQYYNNARCAIRGDNDLELGAAYGYHYTATADL